MTRLKFFIGTVLFILINVEAGPLFSQGEDNPFDESGWGFKFRGHYKNLFYYRNTDEFYGKDLSIIEEKKMFLDLNRLRFSPEVSYGSKFIFHLDYDIDAIWSNYTESLEFENEWQVNDYSSLLKSKVDYKKDPMYYRTGVHRAYMKLSPGNFTITAGRQLVRFGSSKLWNPLDLLNPVSPTAIEGTEDQTGIDALKIDWFFMNIFEVSAVYNPLRKGDDLEKMDRESSNYVGRVKLTGESADLAVLGGYVSKRKVCGSDFTLTLFDGQLTGVVFYSKPDELEEGFFQSGAGYEYTFANGLYLLGEFFYNERGINDDSLLQNALTSYISDGYDESSFNVLSNRIITYNSYYFSLSAGYDIITLLRVNIFVIYDFQGRGAFLNGSLVYSVSDNVELSGGFLIAKTSSSERVSDFEIYDMKPALYSYVKFYF